MFETIVLLTAGSLTAMLAGIFFGYEVSINPALRRLKDLEYVRAMQAINIAIRNPLFFLVFMGPLFVLPLAAYMVYDDGLMRFWSLLAAAVLYYVGPFGITMGGNEPMNQNLAKMSVEQASEAEISETRKHFESRWNKLHTIRTWLSVVAAVLTLIACLA